MTEYASILTKTLPQSISQGPGVEIPDFLMPVMSIPFPLNVMVNTSTDLRERIGSYFNSQAINQGNSSAATTQIFFTLDKGVYRIQGSAFGTAFGGIVASSASPLLGRIFLSSPGGVAGANLTFIPIGPAGVPQIANSFDLTINFSQAGFSISLGTFISTGAAESIGLYGAVQVSKLL